MAGFRSLLYALARLLGDVNAVKKGKVGLLTPLADCSHKQKRGWPLNVSAIYVGTATGRLRQRTIPACA